MTLRWSHDSFDCHRQQKVASYLSINHLFPQDLQRGIVKVNTITRLCFYDWLIVGLLSIQHWIFHVYSDRKQVQQYQQSYTEMKKRRKKVFQMLLSWHSPHTVHTMLHCQAWPPHPPPRDAWTTLLDQFWEQQPILCYL